MANEVIKVTPQTIHDMMEHYRPFLTDKLPPGSKFVAKLSSCTITAYKSGKVLFQGSDAETESTRWGVSELNGPTKRNTIISSHAYSPPSTISKLSIIGSDEVGTGDYFGPIVVVAAFVQANQLDEIQALGVKDSKDLTDEKIHQIAKAILPVVPHSTLILRNEKYNDIQSNGMSQGKIKALLHNQAINKLVEKIGDDSLIDGVLIDQFVVPETYFKHISGKKRYSGETYFSTKGESVHASVAAASIIARHVFVKEFEKLSQKAGFTLQKGAGSKVDQDASKLINVHGMDSLSQFAKLHFANTEKAKRLL